jgi:tetratricopeptide (TPR) repeat protein
MAKKALIITALLALSAIPFLPGLKAGFTNWDDNLLLTGNNLIREISFSNIGSIFSRPFNGTYIPLTVFTYALEYRLFALNPFFYHLNNLLFHLANAVLVYLLFLSLGEKRAAAFATALFWAVNPLRVESVVWVTERKDVLYLMFLLSSLMAYVRWKRTEKAAAHIISVMLFVLSCLSKGAAVVLPLLLLTVDHFYFNIRLKWKDVVNKAAYWAVSAFFAAAGFLSQTGGDFGPPDEQWGWPGRVFIVCHNVLFYLVKTFLPLKLSIYYPYPKNTSGWLPWHYLAAPVALGALIWLTVRASRKYGRKVAFAPVFFILALLPVLQIKTMMGGAVAAERYAYLPSIPLFLILSLAGEKLWNAAIKPARLVLMPATALLYLASASMAWNRALVWHDSISLWTSLIGQRPEMTFAYKKRALAFRDQGNLGMAVADWDVVLERDPGNTGLRYQRALANGMLGRMDRTLADLNAVIGQQPDNAEAYFNRGYAYKLSASYDQALKDFSRVIELNPRLVEAYINRAEIYLHQAEYREALDDYDTVLGLAPSYGKAYWGRGLVLEAMGKTGAAEKEFLKAGQLGYNPE